MWWFRKKPRRKRISEEFALEILPTIAMSAKNASILRERCQRIMQKDITELSVADLMLHIENIGYGIGDIEASLMNCKSKIKQERE